MIIYNLKFYFYLYFGGFVYFFIITTHSDRVKSFTVSIYS